MNKGIKTLLSLITILCAGGMITVGLGEASSQSLISDTENSKNKSLEECTEAIEGYKRFLSRDSIPWNGGEEILLSEAVQFLTEDITGDGIPELFVRIPSYCYGWIGIFTCVSGTIEDISYCDELGGYYPGTGVFTSLATADYQGNTVEKSTENYQYLKDISEYSSGVVMWRTTIGSTTTKDGTTEYYWQGVYDEETEEKWAEASWEAIPEEEFESNLELLTSGVEKLMIEENWLDNNEENRDKYLR